VAEHLRDEDNARELLKNWKDEGRLLLLLDGLDEVPEEARPAVREDVIDFALSPDGQRCRILVTSRLVGYASLGGEFREFTLKPFQGPGEALPYLKGWLAALKPEWKDEVEERAEALLSEIECHSPLRRVLDNPLLLRLIAEVYAATGQVVGNRAEIYERWIEEVWKRALQRGAPKEKKGYALERLEEIAWQMHNGLHVDLPEEDHELFREKMGLLVRVDRGRVAFSHQTVLEYFVARRLKRAWEENRSGAWRFLQPRLHIPEWREALFLLAGMVAPQDAGDLIRRVERAKSPDEKYLGRDLLLALRLWGEASGVRPDIGALLIRKALDHGETDVRAAAAEVLGEIKNPKAVVHLIEALRDEDAGLRWAAAKALGEMKAPEAVSHLIQALKDEDEAVRWAAARALGEMKAPEAVPHLIQALKDEDEAVRRAAVRALGEMKAPEAVSHLIEALRDEDRGLRRAAAEALGEMKAPEAVPHLIEALRDEDWLVRRAAVRALGEMKAPEAVPHLIEALKDAGLRQPAARALGEMKAPEAVPHLIEALWDVDWLVCRAAARALGEMKAPEAVPHLIEALKDGDEALRRAAGWALGEMKAPEAVPHLIQALKDEEEAVRWAAAWALGKMKAPEAAPHLIEALWDVDWLVRRAAVRALGEMKAPEAVPHLIEALKDGDEALRWAAAESLGEMKAPEAVSHLIQALKDEEEAVRWAAADALGEWAENLYIAQDPRERDELATLLHGVERTLRRARRRGTDVHEPLIAVLNKLSILEPPLYFDPLSPEALAGWRGKWEKLEKKCEPIVGLLSAVAGVATLLLKAPWWVTLVLLFGAVVLSSWWLYRKRRK